MAPCGVVGASSVRLSLCREISRFILSEEEAVLAFLACWVLLSWVSQKGLTSRPKFDSRARRGKMSNEVFLGVIIVCVLGVCLRIYLSRIPKTSQSAINQFKASILKHFIIMFTILMIPGSPSTWKMTSSFSCKVACARPVPVRKSGGHFQCGGCEPVEGRGRSLGDRGLPYGDGQPQRAAEGL